MNVYLNRLGFALGRHRLTRGVQWASVRQAAECSKQVGFRNHYTGDSHPDQLSVTALFLVLIICMFGLERNQVTRWTKRAVIHCCLNFH